MPPSHLAILCVRNEGAFLLEWLAHHRAVGFDSFLVFSNNCQDGTDTMLDRLAAMGVVTHVRNDGPYAKGGIQFTALKAAAKHVSVQQAEWILPLDVDEFVNIHCGDHTLDALHAAIPMPPPSPSRGDFSARMNRSDIPILRCSIPSPKPPPP